MKTLKTRLFALGIVSIALLGSLSAGASGNEDKKDVLETSDFTAYLDNHYLERNIEEMMMDEGQVRVMDSHEEMVAEGKITDEAIKRYMSISDLVTEVDGVKYFRLSYQ